MPVHRHKKDTTPTPPSATPEQTTPPLPDQQTFRQYLRELARGAIGVVLEDVMREELDALIGVGWGECNPKRKGYRNGFYSRDLVTSSGRLEDLKVPRDREGHFHTQVFDRYSRYEPHIAEGRDGDVRGRHEHPQGRRSGPNAYGSRSKSPARLVVSTRR
jgi:putative transposase